MKQIVLTDISTLELQDVEIPQPNDTDVIIRTELAGICGSDIHFYKKEYSGTQFPLVLGHEIVGTVYSLGDKVENVTIGDLVTVEPGIGCGQCQYCVRGDYNLCRSQDFIGGRPDFPGGFAQYVRVPSDMIIPLPKIISLKEACLVEPLAVAMHIMGRANIEQGDSVCIIGSGAIGLLTLLAAKLEGATLTVISDLSDARLVVAKNLGADYTVNAEQDLDLWVSEIIPNGIDVVIDTASVGNTFSQAVQIVKSGGRVVNVGEATKPVIFDRNLLGREIEITGSRQYTRKDFDRAISLISSGKLDISKLPTQVLPMTKYEEAFKIAIEAQDIIKVMIAPFDNHEVN